MRNKVNPEENNLLKSLSRKDLNLLLPHLSPFEGESGTILYEPGDEVKYTYFPCNKTLISFLIPIDDDKAVETALIGKEGAVGGIVSQGRLPAYCRAAVQFPGTILRIESSRLEDAKAESDSLQHFFARYADCLLAQVFQSVACNATHTIEQRAAKWLIATWERTGENTLPLTQDFLAGMLGVGRSYITRVISSMKASGIVKPLRGKLHINNTHLLKKLSCNCQDQVTQHFNTVLKGVYP